MRITVGHARNDTFELISGIVLSVIGGIFIGTISGSPFWHLALVGTVLSIGGGIILEIRVLAKHRHELLKVRRDIEEASNRNTETLRKMDEHQGLIESATNKLDQAMGEIDRQKKEIEVTQEKAFSRFGSLSGFRSLEDDIQKLHERLQKVEEKLGLSFLRKGNTGDTVDNEYEKYLLLLKNEEGRREVYENNLTQSLIVTIITIPSTHL